MADLAESAKPYNALHELIGTDPIGSGDLSKRRIVGKGKAAWIRGVDIEKTPHTQDRWTISTDSIMMPLNAAEIDTLVSWLVPGGLGLHVESDGRLYVHQVRRTDTGEIMVHLINHEYATRAARAVVRMEVAQMPKEVVSISMDEGESDYPERKELFTMAGLTVIVPVEDIQKHRTVIVR